MKKLIKTVIAIIEAIYTQEVLRPTTQEEYNVKLGGQIYY